MLVCTFGVELLTNFVVCDKPYQLPPNNPVAVHFPSALCVVSVSVENLLFLFDVLYCLMYVY